MTPDTRTQLDATAPMSLLTGGATNDNRLHPDHRWDHARRVHPGACVDPKAALMFHGPQFNYGMTAIPREDFDHWSQVLASHYPRQIGKWYLAEGRYGHKPAQRAAKMTDRPMIENSDRGLI